MVFVTLARHEGRWVAVTVRAGHSRIVGLGRVGEVSGLVHRARADLDALAMPTLPAPLREAVRRSLDLTLGRLDAVLVAPLRLGDHPWCVLLGRPAVPALGPAPRPGGRSTVVTPGAASWLRGRSARRGGSARRRGGRAGAAPGCGGGRGVSEVWTGSRSHAGSAATVAAAPGGTPGGRPGARRGARHAPAGQPAVLLGPDGRRASVRLRDRSAGCPGCAGCVVLSSCEAGTVNPSSGGRVFRPDFGASAPRRAFGHCGGGARRRC